MSRRPLSANPASRSHARFDDPEEGESSPAKESSLGSRAQGRPRTADAVRQRKKFQKTLIPQKEKKVHAYKLGKTMSVSLKETIYSKTKRKPMKVPEPVSIIDSSWVAADDTYKGFSSMSIDELAVYNLNLESELVKDHLDFLAGKKHRDLMGRFNTQQEFVDVHRKVNSLKEKAKKEKNARVQAAKKREMKDNALMNSPTKLRTNSQIAKHFDPLGLTSMGAPRQQSIRFDHQDKGESKGEDIPDLKSLIKKGKSKFNGDNGKGALQEPQMNTEHLDILSAEVEFQRALVLCYDDFGKRHPLYETAASNLRQIYHMQYLDKLDFIKELSEDPKAHVNRIRDLIIKADYYAKQEKEQEKAVKKNRQVIYLKSKAQTLAEQTRNALKLRGKLNQWKNLESQLEQVSDLSHSMRLNQSTEYLALKGVKDFGVLGQSAEGITKKEKRANAVNSILGKLTTPERKEREKNKSTAGDGKEEGEDGQKEGVAKNFKRLTHSSLLSSHLTVGAAEWRFSNRLDPYFGEELRIHETSVDSMVRASRKEFGLVAKSAQSRIKSGKCDPTDEHLFRASLGQLKSHPRINDFLANVTVTAPEVCIVGEPFNIHYSYVHKKQRDRLHCPGDWLGIFLLTEDKKEDLVCWHEIPELVNEYSLVVDKEAIKTEGEYFAAYFVNGSDKPLSKSETFLPKFVKAKVEIDRTKEVKHSESLRVDESEGIASIICGVSFVVKFDISHSVDFIHNHNDTVGLVKCTKDGVPIGIDVTTEGWGGLAKRAAVKVVKLPKDTNTGEIVLEHGCSLPGYYRLMFFAYEQGNRVCGKSGCIKAVRDFGEAEAWKKKKIKNRLFRIYISTRWDMEAERTMWREVIVPLLRLYCDDRFIDFAYVECAIPNGDVAWQNGSEAMSRMLHGIKYCSPVFVCCLGEMLSLQVGRKAMSSDFKEEMRSKFPFLSTMVFNEDVRVIPTTTEVELMEALFVPCMEEDMQKEDLESEGRKVATAAGPEVSSASAANHTFFFTRHPSLRSIDFPDFMANLKGINTISNIRKKKGELKDVLARIEEKTITVRPMPPKYANMNELSNMMLSAIKGSIESIWPSSNAPEFLDRFAIETEIAMDFLRYGYVRHLDQFTYISGDKGGDSSDGGRGDADGVGGLTKIYRPIVEKSMQGGVGMHLPARTRAVLQGKKNRPLTFYEILERHCDAVNNNLMIVVDSPNCGVTLKLSNFIAGYIKNHRGEVHLPQWGVCRNRGIIKRFFKTVSVKIGLNQSTELLVKTKKEINDGTMRLCLVLFVDLRRPSHRWKVGNMCKYILRELKRTFHMDIDIPDVDMDCVHALGDWFQAVATMGDVILVLDGIDQVDTGKEEDPFWFLPEEIPSCIRIICSCHLLSRAFISLTTNYNEREAIIIKRKSNMTEEHKVKLIDGVAKKLGFAVSLDSVLPLLSSEKTNAVGYLRCVLEELYYMRLFEGAGVYNEDRKWGLWDAVALNLDPDCCGGKMIRDGIAGTCNKLLDKCDSRFMLYEERLKRLMDTCPFFEISICCIRLARRGLGEDELRRILYGKKTAKMEWKRQERLRAVEEERDEGQERQEGEQEGEEKKDVDRINLENVRGPQEVVVTTEDILSLLERLEEVCMSCFGKFTLANMEIQNAIDKIMLSNFARTEEGATDEIGHKTKESKGNTDRWKSFYLQVMIDMFNKSLVSFRKAEELPFLAKYYAKTIDPKKDPKKVVKWRETILRMVLEVDMFYRLADDMLIDDLVRCLHFCHAKPVNVIEILKSNFERYFGLNVKKNFGYNYETLGQKSVGADLNHFRVNGGKILQSMSKFCLKHLHNATKVAEEMAETSLLLNFKGKKFPRVGEGPLTHGWTMFPLDSSLAVETIILLSSIYIQRVRICQESMVKREAKTQKAANSALLTGQSKGGKLVTAMHMRGMGKITKKQKTGKKQTALGADGDADQEKSDGIDPIFILQKLEHLSKHTRTMEENGLNEVLIDALAAFDKNEEVFIDIYNELPQARNYRGKRMNRTTWLKDSGDYRVHGLKAIARK